MNKPIQNVLQRPWKVVKFNPPGAVPDVDIRGGPDWDVIAFMSPVFKSEVNARHLVKCVNSHDEMVEQLRKAWACIELLKEHASDYEKKVSQALLKDIGSLIAKDEGRDE